MTQEQLKNLDKYLIPDNPNTNRHVLILFFYNIKSNWDNYRIGKSICKIPINWNTRNKEELNKIIGDKSNNTLRPILAALYYNYLIVNNPKDGLWDKIKETFNIQKKYNLNAKRFFKSQSQCPNNNINKKNYFNNIIQYKTNNNNLNYYYNQSERYYGNR